MLSKRGNATGPGMGSQCAPKVVIPNRLLGHVARWRWKWFHVKGLSLLAEHRRCSGQVKMKVKGRELRTRFRRLSERTQVDIFIVLLATQPLPILKCDFSRSCDFLRLPSAPSRSTVENSDVFARFSSSNGPLRTGKRVQCPPKAALFAVTNTDVVNAT